LGEAPRIAIEAGVAQGWHEWLRPGDRFVGLSDFGASAPAADVFRHFGLTAPRIAEEAQRLVSR
jgi:transketolase